MYILIYTNVLHSEFILLINLYLYIYVIGKIVINFPSLMYIWVVIIF